jgi:probable HAF family extracellular repeat protein
MNRRTTFSCLLALAAMAAPPRVAAQGYTVLTLGDLGGTASGGISIDERSWVGGLSNLPGDQVAHATLWRGEKPFDLGTLGGPNSAIAWPVKNDHGLLVGISELADPDPNGARFSCAGFFGTPLTGRSCRGFRWENGLMTALPPFAGGVNSFGAGANDLGDAVGWAENGVHDATCVAPRQVLQFRAAVWRADGTMTELPPLGGDPTSAATATNDKRQVVGISGLCDRAVGRFSAQHMVLWENGAPSEIPNLGGSAWNTPTAINADGVVVGFSDLPGDTGGAANFHAFLWTKEGGLVDLGTLPGDAVSIAYGVNRKGQVVGQSIGAGGSRAFLWENGVMVDLNDRTAPGAPYLVYANDIDDRGAITGGACTACAGESLAFKALPNSSSVVNAAASTRAARKGAMTRALRTDLRRRFGIELSDVP